MAGCRFVDIQAVDVRGAPVARVHPPEEVVRGAVFRILHGTVLLSAATIAPDCQAHINTAYFSYSDDLRVYFLSHPASFHCRNLSRNPSMAATVCSSTQRWAESDEGLQLFGKCEQVSEFVAGRAERSYQSRFEAYGKWKAALRTDDAGSQYRFYEFDVDSLKVVDEKHIGDGVVVRAVVVRS